MSLADELRRWYYKDYTTPVKLDQDPEALAKAEAEWKKYEAEMRPMPYIEPTNREERHKAYVLNSEPQINPFYGSYLKESDTEWTKDLKLDYVASKDDDYLSIYHDMQTMEPYIYAKQYRPLLKSWWDQGHGDFGRLAKFFSYESFVFMFEKCYPGIIYDFYICRDYNSKGGLFSKLYGRAPVKMSKMEFRNLVSVFLDAILQMININQNIPPGALFLLLFKSQPYSRHPLNQYITRGYSINV